MTEQRNSRIALLAVTMLLSGALLGLVMSDDSSAATQHKVVGFVNSDGVSVEIIESSSGDKKTDSTDGGGGFEFNNLESGNYMVRYSKVGYLSILDSWDIPEDLPFSDTINMVEVASGDTNISGYVNDTDGVGISGAFVYIMNNSVPEDSWWPNVSVGYTLSAITDSNGSYSFSYLSSGDYAMRVEAAGYYTKYLGLNFESSWDISLDSHSDANKQSIRVKDDEGFWLSSASVFMYDLDTSTWEQATKNGAYTYILKPDTSSTVYVYAYHDDYKPDVKKLTAVSGTNSFDMILGQNSASSKNMIYIPSAPSFGAQSALPLMGTKLIKLNPGPTASVTSSADSDDGTYILGVGESLNLSASSSTAPVGLDTYAWTGGQTTEYYNNTFVAGTHEIQLTVSDSFGQTNSTTVTVIADGDDPVAVFASLSKDSPTENGTAVNDTNVNEDYTTVVFNASTSTDSSSSVASYHWDFGDGTTNTGEVANHIFDNPGTFSVVLNVTDEAGNYNTTSQDIVVQDLTAPNAEFNWSYELDGETFPNSALEDVATKFDAGLSTDNSDGALTYSWEFGDGNATTGKVVEHTFSETTDEGYDVKLVVADASGNEDIISYKVKPSLRERPDLFISSLTFSNENPEEGDTVTLTANLKLLGMNVTDAFEVGFYLDNPSGTLIASKMIDGAELANLTIGTEHDFNITVDWTAVSGAHTISVIADSTNLIDEATEKNELSKVITVSAEDDSRDVTSIMLIVAVVLLSVGAVGYIYRDRLFNN